MFRNFDVVCPFRTVYAVAKSSKERRMMPYPVRQLCALPFMKSGDHAVLHISIKVPCYADFSLHVDA
jgi:hypothetical protein